MRARQDRVRGRRARAQHARGRGAARARCGPTSLLSRPALSAGLGGEERCAERLPAFTDEERAEAHQSMEGGDVLLGEGRFDPPTTMLDENGQGVPYATYGFAAQIAVCMQIGAPEVRCVPALMTTLRCLPLDSIVFHTVAKFVGN